MCLRCGIYGDFDKECVSVFFIFLCWVFGGWNWRYCKLEWGYVGFFLWVSVEFLFWDYFFEFVVIEYWCKGYI